MSTKSLNSISRVRASLDQGQTLIETMVAVFMLVMGVTAAVGLAIFAFNSSTSITKQIIATGLAREGIEAVKNMRDTNWLKDTLTVNGCYDYLTSQASKANCYQNWLGNAAGSVPFCLNPTSGNGPCVGDISAYNNVVHFDASNANFWLKYRQSLVPGYGLAFNPAGGNEGFYTTGTTGLACQDGASENGLIISEYCRKIIISKITSSPFDKDVGPLLLVQSQVWWVDKKCPRASDYTPGMPCSLELDTYLTNWKNY